MKLEKIQRKLNSGIAKKIKEGCTVFNDSTVQEPQVIESYSNKEKALEELKKYKSDITKLSNHGMTYYLVTEFYVEENEYDSEGEWINGGDIWRFTELPELD